MPNTAVIPTGEVAAPLPGAEGETASDFNAAISAAQVVQPVRDALIKLLRKDPALSFTLAYLLLTVVGITYDCWYFHFFGVNVLDYAHFSDLLLAAVREPLVIFFTVLSVTCSLLLQEINYRARRRFALYDKWSRSKWIRAAQPLLFFSPRVYVVAAIVVYFGGVFTPLYAQYRANLVRAGHTRPVTVRLASDPAAKPITLPMIGITSRYVFLYDRSTRQTHVIPVENIAEMTITRPAETR